MRVYVEAYINIIHISVIIFKYLMDKRGWHHDAACCDTCSFM